MRAAAPPKSENRQFFVNSRKIGFLNVDSIGRSIDRLDPFFNAKRSHAFLYKSDKNWQRYSTFFAGPSIVHIWQELQFMARRTETNIKCTHIH